MPLIFKNLYLKKWNWAQLFLLLLSTSILQAGQLSDIFYLTFEEEETWKSVTVNFISSSGRIPGKVYYDVKSRNASQKKYTFEQQGRIDNLGKIRGKNSFLHRVKLRNLQANTIYYFIAGNRAIGYSREMKFRTPPSDNSVVRLVVGGDLGIESDLSAVSQLAMKEEPHAILVGGDLAYDDGFVVNRKKWLSWFSLMKDVMITPQGYLVPLITAIGNHEVNFLKTRSFYLRLFPQGVEAKRTYFARKLGNHTVLIVLDSGHYHSYKDQVNWLRKTMKKYQNLPNRIALYHVPIFPSYRRTNWNKNKGLKHWQPLFDQYNLTVALEHHDHTLKRSAPIKGRAIAKKGTVYLGDGCWGRPSRPLSDSYSRWYLDKVKSVNHVWGLEVSPGSIKAKATGIGGVIYDYVDIINTPLKTTVQDLNPAFP